MEVYRITRQKYERDLSGNGAAVAGGRWNEIGKPVLYAASSRSLAILETLVHLRQPQPPPDYRIMVLYVPDTMPMLAIADRELPAGWRHNEVYTQQRGSLWLSDNSCVSLRVPSVIVRAEYNLLLNPAHPFFSEIRLIAVEPIEFDARFFQKLNA